MRHWDDEAKAPFLWNPATHAFISYEDPESIAIKASYVRAHRLGGMMFWEIGEDYRGELLDAIRSSIHLRSTDAGRAPTW